MEHQAAAGKLVGMEYQVRSSANLQEYLPKDFRPSLSVSRCHPGEGSTGSSSRNSSYPQHQQQPPKLPGFEIIPPAGSSIKRYPHPTVAAVVAAAAAANDSPQQQQLPQASVPSAVVETLNTIRRRSVDHSSIRLPQQPHPHFNPGAVSMTTGAQQPPPPPAAAVVAAARLAGPGGLVLPPDTVLRPAVIPPSSQQPTDLSTSGVRKAEQL